MRRRRNPDMGKVHWVPLSSLSDEQIAKIPRKNFSKQEWDSLSPELKERIYENDESGDILVGYLARYITNQFWNAYDRAKSSEQRRDLVENWLNSPESEETLERLEKEWRVDFWPYEQYGFTDQQISAVLRRALMSPYAWTIETVPNTRHSPSSCDVSIPLTIHVSLVGYNIPYLEKLTAYEVMRALNEVPQELVDAAGGEQNLANELIAMLEDRNHITVIDNVDTEKHLCIRSSKVEDVFEKLIWDEKPLGEAPAETIEVELPGEWAWWRMKANHLVDDGAEMRHCIGDPSKGYIGAVLADRLMTFSLRDPRGKRVLTAAIDVSDDGNFSFNQIKGKANRIPGFASNSPGLDEKMIKPNELAMSVHLLQSLGMPPFGNDLGYAWAAAIHGNYDARKVDPDLWQVVEKYKPFVRHEDLGEEVAYRRFVQDRERDNPRSARRTFDQPYRSTFATRKR